MREKEVRVLSAEDHYTLCSGSPVEGTAPGGPVALRFGSACLNPCLENFDWKLCLGESDGGPIGFYQRWAGAVSW